MYSQFLYFIIVIFICSLYQPKENPDFSFYESLLFFILLSGSFAASTWLKFRKISQQLGTQPIGTLDRQFSDAVTFHTVLAIILLALSLFGLHLTDFLLQFKLFVLIPTLFAMAGVLIFVFLLAIIWKSSHNLYQKIYHNALSAKDYLSSNFAFAIPVILPWLMLSIIADLLYLIPFDPLKQFFASTRGEIVFFLLFLFIVAIMGPFFIQKLWRCKPLQEGYPRDRIQALCRKARLEIKDILYWPLFGGKMVTAGIMGLVKTFRYILITPSLVRLLSPEEMDAVIAHEIGHIKKKHLLLYLFLLAGFFIISYAAFNLTSLFFILFPAALEIVLNTGIKAPTMLSLLMNVIFALSFIVYFRYVFGFFMRNFERQADAYIFQLFSSASPLMTTLNKIAITSGISPEKPNWHHFSIKERMQFLEKCEFNKAWITHQDRKIKTGLIAYLAGILLIGIIQWSLSNIGIENKFSLALYETAIMAEVKTSPKDPLLYSLLGDLYQEYKAYDKAVSAYDTSLYLFPENPVVQNNLAWLLVTCPDDEIKNPKRALTLAKKAAAVDESPYILDTLAECYYVNKMFEQAADAAKRALELADKNRPYFEKQFEKFNAAVGQAAPS